MSDPVSDAVSGSVSGPVHGSVSEQVLETPHGPARLVTTPAADPSATLLLSHGAGNGIDTRDLEALAGALPSQGVTVVRLEQPWKVAGRRVATPPPTLDAALVAAVHAVRADAAAAALPLVVGGRSAGARSAARCASRVEAAGCLALAFPVHPPGKPEKTRLGELEGVGVPTLVVQGERDTMGLPDELPGHVDVSVVPGADHGFKVAARGGVSQDEALEIIVESVLEWLVREVTGAETT